MSFTQSGINPRVFFLLLIHFLSNKLQQQTPKTYDCTQWVHGSDYVCEITDDITKSYMTANRKGIKRGDYLILQNGSELCRYQVEEIDYYSNPPNMWMALLKNVTDTK